jgi:hypothetical protein
MLASGYSPVYPAHVPPEFRVRCVGTGPFKLIPHQTVYSFGRMQEVWLESR